MRFFSKTRDFWDSLKSGDADAVKSFLDGGTDPNTKTKLKGETPLIFASKENYPKIVRLLIQAGADVNSQNRFGVTALMCAVEAGYLQIIKSLLEAGADANIKDGNNASAVWWAAKSGNVEIAQLLLEAGADVRTADILNTAVSGGYIKFVEFLIRAGADINAKWGSYNITALMVAAESGHLEITRALIDAGADVNAKTVKGITIGIATTDANAERTALILATTSGHTEVVRALVEGGADVDFRVKGGSAMYEETALERASRLGHTEIVRILVEAGAYEREQAIRYASLTTQEEEIKRILQTPRSKLQRVESSCHTCDGQIQEVAISQKEYLELFLFAKGHTGPRGIQCISCKAMYCDSCMYKELKVSFNSWKTRFEVGGNCKKCNVKLTADILLLVSRQDMPASRLSE